jgi:mRNA interferase RelE/StbE
MIYQVVFEQDAVDELKQLDELVSRRIILRIKWLATHFENLKPQSLTGPLKGYFKLRIGHYRIIYSVNHQDKSIFISHIGHRRDIYKRP